MSEKRYRLELREVETKRVTLLDREFSAHELSTLTVVRCENPREARLVAISLPREANIMTIYSDMEFYAVEVPTEMKAETATGCTCPMCDFHRSAERVEKRKAEICPPCKAANPGANCARCHLPYMNSDN